MQPPNPYQPPIQWQPPQPPGPPPKKKRRWWIWTLVIIGFIVLVGSCNAIITGGKGIGNTDATPTPSSVSQRVVKVVTNTPTTKPTRTQPTTIPTESSSVTHGRPRVGGPLSDFVGKYGQAVSQTGDSQNFYTDSAQTIYLGAQPDSHGVITRITVLGVDSWSSATTQNFCEQYLPDDAQQFNRANGSPTFIDYHSSLGEVIMQLQAPTCLIFVSQS